MQIMKQIPMVFLRTKKKFKNVVFYAGYVKSAKMEKNLVLQIQDFKMKI